MKKTLILIVLTILLIGGSLYTVSTYNKSNIENKAAASSKEAIQLPDSSGGKISTPLFQGNKIKIKTQDFNLKDLNGNEVTLSVLKGKKVLLNFWATWCPPCKAEMPDLEKLYNETKSSDLVILAVNIGEDKGTVKSFIEKNGYNFKILLDTDQEVSQKFNISSMPTSFFIDKEGFIRATHIGAMNLEQMKSYVQILDK